MLTKNKMIIDTIKQQDYQNKSNLNSLQNVLLTDGKQRDSNNDNDKKKAHIIQNNLKQPKTQNSNNNKYYDFEYKPLQYQKYNRSQSYDYQKNLQHQKQKILQKENFNSQLSQQSQNYIPLSRAEKIFKQKQQQKNFKTQYSQKFLNEDQFRQNKTENNFNNNQISSQQQFQYFKTENKFELGQKKVSQVEQEIFLSNIPKSVQKNTKLNKVQVEFQPNQNSFMQQSQNFQQVQKQSLLSFEKSQIYQSKSNNFSSQQNKQYDQHYIDRPFTQKLGNRHLNNQKKYSQIKNNHNPDILLQQLVVNTKDKKKNQFQKETIKNCNVKSGQKMNNRQNQQNSLKQQIQKQNIIDKNNDNNDMQTKINQQNDQVDENSQNMSSFRPYETSENFNQILESVKNSKLKEDQNISYLNNSLQIDDNNINQKEQNSQIQNKQTINNFRVNRCLTSYKKEGKNKEYKKKFYQNNQSLNQSNSNFETPQISQREQEQEQKQKQVQEINSNSNSISNSISEKIIKHIGQSNTFLNLENININDNFDLNRNPQVNLDFNSLYSEIDYDKKKLTSKLKLKRSVRKIQRQNIDGIENGQQYLSLSQKKILYKESSDSSQKINNMKQIARLQTNDTNLTNFSEDKQQYQEQLFSNLLSKHKFNEDLSETLNYQQQNTQDQKQDTKVKQKQQNLNVVTPILEVGFLNIQDLQDQQTEKQYNNIQQQQNISYSPKLKHKIQPKKSKVITNSKFNSNYQVKNNKVQEKQQDQLDINNKGQNNINQDLLNLDNEQKQYQLDFQNIDQINSVLQYYDVNKQNLTQRKQNESKTSEEFENNDNVDCVDKNQDNYDEQNKNIETQNLQDKNNQGQNQKQINQNKIDVAQQNLQYNANIESNYQYENNNFNCSRNQFQNQFNQSFIQGAILKSNKNLQNKGKFSYIQKQKIYQQKLKVQKQKHENPYKDIQLQNELQKQNQSKIRSFTFHNKFQNSQLQSSLVESNFNKTIINNNQNKNQIDQNQENDKNFEQKKLNNKRPQTCHTRGSSYLKYAEQNQQKQESDIDIEYLNNQYNQNNQNQSLIEVISKQQRKQSSQKSFQSSLVQNINIEKNEKNKSFRQYQQMIANDGQLLKQQYMDKSIQQDSNIINNDINFNFSQTSFKFNYNHNEKKDFKLQIMDERFLNNLLQYQEQFDKQQQKYNQKNYQVYDQRKHNINKEFKVKNQFQVTQQKYYQNQKDLKLDQKIRKKSMNDLQIQQKKLLVQDQKQKQNNQFGKDFDYLQFKEYNEYEQFFFDLILQNQPQILKSEYSRKILKIQCIKNFCQMMNKKRQTAGNKVQNPELIVESAKKKLQQWDKNIEQQTLLNQPIQQLEINQNSSKLKGYENINYKINLSLVSIQSDKDKVQYLEKVINSMEKQENNKIIEVNQTEENQNKEDSSSIITDFLPIRNFISNNLQNNNSQISNISPKRLQNQKSEKEQNNCTDEKLQLINQRKWQKWNKSLPGTPFNHSQKNLNEIQNHENNKQIQQQYLQFQPWNQDQDEKNQQIFVNNYQGAFKPLSIQDLQNQSQENSQQSFSGIYQQNNKNIKKSQKQQNFTSLQSFINSPQKKIQLQQQRGSLQLYNNKSQIFQKDYENKRQIKSSYQQNRQSLYDNNQIQEINQKRKASYQEFDIHDFLNFQNEQNQKSPKQEKILDNNKNVQFQSENVENGQKLYQQ
ncbi:hypothetical protein PPERSA_01580 [Pseudocohnilembus persalinus]|uniref:Uncharacterized protein n=1 Tax=Pseudocohnilembus persalinus TaxID=266149 RepID=A0A0V0QHP5_PSEPJ|nr:hypothetical protein PPERSA_01580 [Pseudocohnilembus persalinus]|eukprot:KRX01710.1 hypothetical protein PPERSA_01580 [Pseudocohnilembus persalinus]